MKTVKKITVIILMITSFSLLTKVSQAQMFWLGFNGGYQYAWFKSPSINDSISGEGAGWNLGFFLKYGKRPFYQVEFRWMRAKNTLTDSYEIPGLTVTGDVPFHKFEMPVKVGYNIIQKPMFKWQVNGGASIGTVFLFSSNIYDIQRKDMANPQFAVLGGTGIQFMNFIIDVDYAYHITDLFKADKETFGESFGSHLQVVSVKVGMLF
jgi:hypothetical protein